jgi:hypothetical protein
VSWLRSIKVGKGREQKRSTEAALLQESAAGAAAQVMITHAVKGAIIEHY